MSTHFHKKPNMYTSHVQLKVSELQRSLEFYTKVVGFKELDRKDNAIYLTTDGTTSILSLLEVENAIPLQRGTTGLYHIALLLPSRKDMGNLIQHLIDVRLPIGTGDHHVSEALYFNDPDGNGIEMYIDRPEEDWLWNNNQVYMTTEEVDVMSLLKEADGTWDGLPKDTVMGHVHLSVSDIKESRNFYTNVLDYEVVTEYGRQALFISTGSYHHHFGLNTWNGSNGVLAKENSVGLNSITIVLKDEDYKNHVKSQLQGAGFTVEAYDKEPLYGGKQSFSTVDPNGFRLIFTLEGNE